MFKVFLSPSTQEYNLYLSEGNEEYYMNLIADRVEQNLEKNGVMIARNDPLGDFNDAIKLSNADDYSLHVAIHSNASPPNLAGKMKGPVIFYFPTSVKSAGAANIFAKRFRKIYPDAQKVSILPSNTLSELKRTTAPGVYVEVAYHDNPDDENWIRQNIDIIAREISEAVLEYLDKYAD